MTTIDAPLFITCTDHDCYDCAEGGSSGRHAIRCACGKDAVELLAADGEDGRFTVGYCRSCLDLIESDAVPLVKRRWPLSVTQCGEHPAFVDVYRAGTHPMHESPVPSKREFRKTLAEVVTLMAGVLRVVR